MVILFFFITKLFKLNPHYALGFRYEVLRYNKD